MPNLLSCTRSGSFLQSVPMIALTIASFDVGQYPTYLRVHIHDKCIDMTGALIRSIGKLLPPRSRESSQTPFFPTIFNTFGVRETDCNCNTGRVGRNYDLPISAGSHRRSFRAPITMLTILASYRISERCHFIVTACKHQSLTISSLEYIISSMMQIDLLNFATDCCNTCLASCALRPWDCSVAESILVVPLNGCHTQS